MPDIRQEKRQYARAGARRLIEQVPKTFAGLAVLCGVAYLAGSFYTRAYFAEFGASWILEEIPAATYFSQSWVPLLLILYLGYLATTNLAISGNEEHPTAKERRPVSVVVVRYGFWSLLVLLLVVPLCSLLGYMMPAIGCSILAVVILLLLLSSAVELVLLRLRTPEGSLELSLAHLSFVVIAAGLYILPTQLGANWARVDRQPASSLLTVYVHSEREKAYRLLFSAGERLYIFPALFEGAYPPVHATAVTDVGFIPPEQ